MQDYDYCTSAQGFFMDYEVSKRMMTLPLATIHSYSTRSFCGGMLQKHQLHFSDIGRHRTTAEFLENSMPTWEPPRSHAFSWPMASRQFQAFRPLHSAHSPEYVNYLGITENPVLSKKSKTQQCSVCRPDATLQKSRCLLHSASTWSGTTVHGSLMSGVYGIRHAW